jgi:hypothetical protein
MTALVIHSTPQSVLHRAGALVVLAAALTSLGYSIVAGELSFLAIYIVSLVGGAALALRTAGAEYGQAKVLSIFLVVF